MANAEQDAFVRLLSEVLAAATSSSNEMLDALAVCLHAYCTDLREASKAQRASTHAGVRSAMLACASFLMRAADKPLKQVMYAYALLLHAPLVGLPENLPSSSAGGDAISVESLLLWNACAEVPSPQVVEQALARIGSAFGLDRFAATMREVVMRLRVNPGTLRSANGSATVGQAARERCIEPARILMQDLFDADGYGEALDAERAAWRYLLAMRDGKVPADALQGDENLLQLLQDFVEDCMDAGRLHARVVRRGRDDDDDGDDGTPPLLEEMVARLELVPRTTAQNGAASFLPVDATMLQRIASSSPNAIFPEVVEGIRVAAIACSIPGPMFAPQQHPHAQHGKERHRRSSRKPPCVVPALRILGIARDRRQTAGSECTVAVLVRWKTLVLFSPLPAAASVEELLHPYKPSAAVSDLSERREEQADAQKRRIIEVEDAWVPFGSECLSCMRLILVRDFFERSGIGCDPSQPATVGWYALRLVSSAAYGGALVWTMGIVVSVASGTRCEVLYDNGGVGWHDQASLLQEAGSFSFFYFTNALRGLHKMQRRPMQPKKAEDGKQEGDGEDGSKTLLLAAWLRETGLHNFFARECSSYEQGYGARLLAVARALMNEYAGLQ